jgi:hypothetical protein
MMVRRGICFAFPGFDSVATMLATNPAARCGSRKKDRHFILGSPFTCCLVRIDRSDQDPAYLPVSNDWRDPIILHRKGKTQVAQTENNSSSLA